MSNQDLPENHTVSFNIGPNTRYIISTSGRLTSMQRYKRLLQEELNLDIAYLPIHSMNSSDPKIDPQSFVWTLRGLPCIGGAISRDIKELVVPFLDEVDDLAKEINSVNTIIRRGNHLKGYNTDALGFRAAIDNGIKASGIEVKRAVVYGYGGVTNCVVSVLKSLGIEVFLTGRRPDAVKAKAVQLCVQPWTNDLKGEIDLFVNASPVTHHSLSDAINFLDAIEGCRIAFDHEMPGLYLEKHCHEQKIFLIKGTDMYLPQMLAQWELFLDGYMDDVTDLREIFQRIEPNRLNEAK